MNSPGSVDAAVNFVRARWAGTPKVALVLGTGLGNVATEIQAEVTIPFAEIPGFPHSTAVGHRGQLICGRLANVSVVAMQGRSHLYEGHSRATVALPTLVMRALGAEMLIVSNASGGVNPQLRSGDVLVMTDHIDLMRTRQMGQIATAPRFANPYDQHLIELALSVARRENFHAMRGVYVALTGPNYETRAEYRMVRRIGGDVVGMSTVPEVIAAASCGFRVLALSVVANVANPDKLEKTSGEEVVAAVTRAEHKLRKIVAAVIDDAAT